VAQGVNRSIAPLFHDCGTRRGWVVNSTPRPHFALGKDPVSVVQEAEWAPGPVWAGGKSRAHRDSISDRPARSPVAIPTGLPAPRAYKNYNKIISGILLVFIHQLWVNIVCNMVDPTGESNKEIIETLLQNIHLLGKMGQLFFFGSQFRLFRRVIGLI